MDNAAQIEALRHDCKIAIGVLNRWEKRCHNTMAKIPLPESLALDISLLDAKSATLFAHKDQIRPGQTKATLPLYLESGVESIDIVLDSKQTPLQIATAFRKKAGKLRRAIERIPEQKSIIYKELEEIRVTRIKILLIQSTVRVDDVESVCFVEKKMLRNFQREFDTLRKKLIPRGLWPQSVKKKDDCPPKGPIRWDLDDGWIIWAGKDGMENDLITGKLAKSHDLWFHAAHVPGSHVILRSPTGKPMDVPHEHKIKAASVAAWLSRSRAQDLADVHCTLKKYVRKPRKSPPGLVVMEHYSVMRVQPSPPPRLK